MKKVLFVLGLAVCTTAAMAQTTKMVPRVGEGPQKANIRMASNDRVDYKASIFTKDDDQVVYTFTFASDQMTGILYGAKDNAGMKSGDTVYVDGEATLINATTQHGRSESNTYWTRISTVNAISDTTSAEAVDFTTNYPQSRNYGAVNIPAYMGSQNGIEEDNGFMFISLIEYFNNTGKGDVNAYFQLPGVELPADAQILDIQWRQYHRKFYEDCHVDYKLNGKSVDFQDIMIAIAENRATSVEGEVTPLSTRITNRNEKLENLGNVLADLTKLQAQFESDDDGDKRRGYLQQSSKDILISLFGSLDWSDLHMTKYEVEEWLQTVKSKIDALNNEAQKDMTRLQSLVDRRDEAFSTASDLMSKIGDTRSNLIRNL